MYSYIAFLCLFFFWEYNEQAIDHVVVIYSHRASSLWKEEPGSNKETGGLPNVLTSV